MPGVHCTKATVKKAVSLFLQILLFHKIKVINRSLRDRLAKRNRKAAKICHD